MGTKVRFRKVGGGTFRLGNRIIKPNEVFSADPDEIPKLFMTHLVQLGDDPDAPKIVRTRKDKFAVKEEEPAAELVEEDQVKANSHEVIPDSSPGWFNVMNIETDKQINEKKLRKSAAEKLAAQLNQ